MHTIIRHGAPFVLQTLHRSGCASGYKEATRIARDLQGVSNVYGINLKACYSANGGVCSNAQMLANATGLPVKGYYGKTNLLGIDRATGKIDSSKTFRPQSRLPAFICSVGNRLQSGPLQFGLKIRDLLRPTTE